MIATGETVGLAEWIIDVACLVIFILFKFWIFVVNLFWYHWIIQLANFIDFANKHYFIFHKSTVVWLKNILLVIQW